MIQLRDLEIGYKHRKGKFSVLKNINIEFLPGDLIGLMGDNGIGKSTLLKTLDGTLKPLAGEIIINTKNQNSFSSHQLSQLISIVVTEKIGGFNLTVWDVAASGRTPYINIFGKLTTQDELTILSSLEKLNLLPIKDKLMDELSDGQRQKVMIAKSLTQQTPIIFLDEPTAFLDYNSKHQLFKILKGLCETEKNW